MPKPDYTMWIPDDVLPEDLFSYCGSGTFSIQKFLESKKSFLSNYPIETPEDATRPVTPYNVWLDHICQVADISPKILLVSLQKEQSLISKKAPPSESILKRCLGFGMTDSGDMTQYYGFAQQHIFAADWFKRKHELAIKPIPVDNKLITLTPLTKFTSVLYTYTPWTGSPDSTYYSKWGTHGVYLMWKLWRQYWPEDLSAFVHIDPTTFPA